jgi:formylglycine-generating enzyme required for sulfatase activity
MIPIAAARITLSDRRTRSRWQVDLQPYRIAAHQVTQAEYEAVTGTAYSGSGRLPATGISWWDAIGFCNALSEREKLSPAYEISADTVAWDATADGYRLPTEAEWEHACRADTTGPRYGELNEIAWYRDNSGERIHEVGGKLPNAWSLHDMLGNAWDWCWDLYDPEVYGPYRVLRGGGWFDEHWSCRASVRRRSHPTFQVDDVGFRLSRSTPPPTT